MKHSLAEAHKRVELVETLRELEYAREELIMARAYFSSLIGIRSKGIEKMGDLIKELEMTRILEYSREENIQKEKEVRDSLKSQLAAAKDYAQCASKDMAALTARYKSLEITDIHDMLKITTLREEVRKQRLIIEGMCSMVSNTDTETHGRVEGSKVSLKKSCETDDVEAPFQAAKKRYTGYRASSVKSEIEVEVTAMKCRDGPVMKLEKIEGVRHTTLQLLDSEVCQYMQ